jgi:hypothetical protein
MDRFSETTMTYGNIDRDEDGNPEPAYRYPLECDNCSRTAEGLTQSPDDPGFRLCDTCMEEAVEVNARETAELLAKAGCTPAETLAYVHIFEEVA